jgi:hypothetical protein
MALTAKAAFMVIDLISTTNTRCCQLFRNDRIKPKSNKKKTAPTNGDSYLCAVFLPVL